MEHTLIKELFDILFHKEGQLQGQSYASIVHSGQPLGQQLAVLWYMRGATRIDANGSTWYDFRTPFCSQVILRSIENCDQDADNAFSVGLVRETLFRAGSDGATGQKGACKVANGGYDYGKIVAAVPKAIV